MKIPFVLALTTFIFSFAIHVIVWRLLKPNKYLLWLPAVFFLAPVFACYVFFMLLGFGSPDFDYSIIIWTALLYIPLVVCYTGGFAGIVEYSPSAEILRAISTHPQGIAPLDLHVATLDESALTGKRLKHLQANRLIVTRGEGIFLTSRGKQSVLICNTYRKIFGIKEEAAG